jgi:hypothetical protein
MDPLHPSSSSFNSERESLMRQPSAEDLDAAHQLVSSALGERHVAPPNQEGRVTDATDRPSSTGTSPRPGVAESQAFSTETPEQNEDGTAAGQICR